MQAKPRVVKCDAVRKAIGPRPDARGRFGKFGGQYVPEALVPALRELETNFHEARADASFTNELDSTLTDYIGRETPLYFAERLSEHHRKLTGNDNEIYLKREDLNHTGSHKANNSLGQAMLCKRMGKKRVVAETGAGQHGVATATVCARLGLECVVYMGAKDIQRQEQNVFRMRLLGATIVPVTMGTATLKDATSEAIRDWVTNVETTYYIIGSVCGPHPYPLIVRSFQAVIGRETLLQCMMKWGGRPDYVVACVGGGSNAIGIFDAFIDDWDVELIGVEAGGLGVDTDKHAATLTKGSPGVLHGALSFLLQDDEGQIIDPHSISAGLDYPSIGAEHAYLKDIGRVSYFPATDKEAVDAFKLLSKIEGIIPALETSHAIAYLGTLCKSVTNKRIVVNLSGTGWKDINTVEAYD